MAIRLTNTTTLHLQWFMGDSIPEYAILSHTWDSTGEVSFQEMVSINDDSDHSAAKKSGYAKIVKTCQKAAATEENISYAWVDTCCIDKTSSSELSEAINSMYQWYQKAKVCYAFLGDFDGDLSNIETVLPRCKWFTRGWCLQELIVPPNVELFVAYNLLGIFDVNMPLLYGEGAKAFIQLQEEIIKASNDLSIFGFPHKSISHHPSPDFGSS